MTRFSLWSARLGLLAILLAIAIYGPALPTRMFAQVDLMRMGQEQELLRQQNNALTAEIQALAAEVEALKQDPREVARVAREDLRMLGENEQLFRVVSK